MEATMKITIGALVYLLLASGVTAQAQKPKPATAMSDDFAKTGIKALRTIQGDSHPLGMELEELDPGSSFQTIRKSLEELDVVFADRILSND